MSRKATSWSYGPEVLGLKLTARDLAFLRAVCWSIHPKLGRTRPLTEKTLARLTGIGSPTHAVPQARPPLRETKARIARGRLPQTAFRRRDRLDGRCS